jgi:hypothetical protein
MACERPFRDRVDERLVRLAILTKTRLSALLRPGSLVILVFASLFGVGVILKAAEFPDRETWKPGAPAMYPFLICGAITYLGYVLVILGYGRSLRSREEEDKLYRACRDIAALVEQKTTLDRASIGVHVWTVRGMPGLRRLERRATFVPGDRPPTAIVWRKGKGAIGRCWERDEWFVADLEALQEKAPNERAFCALLPEERLFFDWSEFASTTHYKGVLVQPLHGGPVAAPHVVGCLSIDVQEWGAADQLEAFRANAWTEFAVHVALCEAVLRHP